MFTTRRFFQALGIAGITAGAGLSGCTQECNGNIECLVLYAKPGPKSVGRFIYVDVSNKPGMGIKKTLLYEGREFGTFEHVVIINDPKNKFATTQKVCFTRYRTNPPEKDGDLQEADIPRIQPEE